MSLDVSLFNLPSQYVYDANITHNLAPMASAAGIYNALWHPEEINATHAKHIIEILRIGLIDLKLRGNYYVKYNAENGWGKYEHFVPFVEDYLNACIENPESEIIVSR